MFRAIVILVLILYYADATRLLDRPLTEKVARFSASAPPELLNEFDGMVSRLGVDRSKALQMAMRDFLAGHSWQRAEGTVAGTITFVYDHNVPDLEESLTDLQHHHMGVISSSMHVHLDENDCLTVIAVRGGAGEIRELADEITGSRGVKQARVAIVRP